MRNSKKLVSKWTPAAVFLVCVIFLVLYREAGLPSQVPNQKDIMLSGVNQHDTNDSKSIDSSVSINSLSNLHRLQTADEFLPYFKLLPSLPNLTVAEAVGTCDYDEKEVGQFQFDWTAWWKLEPRPGNETSLYRSKWQSFIQHDLIPWSRVSHHFSGTGIVVVAGGFESINRLRILLRVLRLHHKTTLPIELSYWDYEVTEKERAELSEIYGDTLYFNDLSLSHQILPTINNGWFAPNYQLKTAAVVNSRFSHILLLDSDNIPVIDPAELFNSQVYQTYGTVFWPDMMRTRPEFPMWAITNTPCRRDEYELESGQLLVDKSRYWYHLQLAAWLITQDYFREIILGDKDMFRYAWHALKTDFGTPVKWLSSVGFVGQQPKSDDDDDDVEGVQLKYCGHSFAQHHPDHSSVEGASGSGIAFLHGGLLKTLSAPYMLRMLAVQQGVFSHYKSVSPAMQEDRSKIEYDVGVRDWNCGWYLNRTKHLRPSKFLLADQDLDLDGVPIGKEGLKRLRIAEYDLKYRAKCVDFEHIDARPISDLGVELDGFNTLFRESGGYWMVEQGIRP